MTVSPVGMFLAVGGAFLVALSVALLTTPVAGRIARRRGYMDTPSGRKVHTKPVPRVGGAAICAAFLVAFLAYLLYAKLAGGIHYSTWQVTCLLAGGLLVFGLGFVDDMRGLRPGVKFAVQAAAALIAFLGGIAIHSVDLPVVGTIHLGLLSLPITIFWFLLVVNAINLIDGLDGLAAGVCFFSTVVLLVLSLLGHRYLHAVGLASLAGATLGFLRYNFNPATIFMGDSGSYFLGYTLAALSILGSMKSQASFTILIPVVALGLPLMDAVWTAIRRFIVGKALFGADSDHLHHRLLKLGYTHKRAVLVLYGVTVCLGVGSLLIVHVSDRQAAVILLLIAVVMAVIIRRLGYADYLASHKLRGWVSRLTGFMATNEAWRSFLALQIAISESSSLDEAWEHIMEAGRALGMDYVAMDIGDGAGRWSDYPRYQCRLSAPNLPGRDMSGLDPRQTSRIALPIGNGSGPRGYLILAKETGDRAMDHRAVRRAERLRQTISDLLAGLPPRREGRTVLLSPRAHMPTAYSVTSGLRKVVQDHEAVVQTEEA